MSVEVQFLVCWALSCVFIAGIVAVIMNFDRLAVLALDTIELDIRAFDEARLIAALIYQHPEQWEVSSKELTHPGLGKIQFYSLAGLRVSGPSFGEWEPNSIERRIIWNAIRWRQRVAIGTLVRKHGALG